MDQSLLIPIVIILGIAIYYFFFYNKRMYGLYYDTNSKLYVIQLNGEWYAFDSSYAQYTNLFTTSTITNAPQIKLDSDKLKNKTPIGYANIIPTSSTNNNPALGLFFDQLSGWNIYPMSESVFNKYGFMGTYKNHAYSAFATNFYPPKVGGFTLY